MNCNVADVMVTWERKREKRDQEREGWREQLLKQKVPIRRGMDRGIGSSLGPKNSFSFSSSDPLSEISRLLMA